MLYFEDHKHVFFHKPFFFFFFYSTQKYLNVYMVKEKYIHIKTAKKKSCDLKLYADSKKLKIKCK